MAPSCALRLLCLQRWDPRPRLDKLAFCSLHPQLGGTLLGEQHLHLHQASRSGGARVLLAALQERGLRLRVRDRAGVGLRIKPRRQPLQLLFGWRGGS